MPHLKLKPLPNSNTRASSMQAVTDGVKYLRGRKRTYNGQYSAMEASLITRSSAQTLEDSQNGRLRQKSEMTQHKKTR